MDLAEIKRLIKLVERSQIEELEIQEEGLQIRITKERCMAASPTVFAAPPVQVAPQPVPENQPVAPARDSASGEKADNLIEIKSPMVGTFYRSPSPDANPYINVGDSFESGKILCIIEAMKLMNEIESEISGKIVKILVENAQPVEYNQTLFLIEKA